MPDHFQHLISKLTDNTACIGVLGLGYVGLPLRLRFSEAGYKVIGFDVDAGKIEKLISALIMLAIGFYWERDVFKWKRS